MSREGLQKNEVAYGVPGKWRIKQKLVDGQAVKMSDFYPMIIRADDRCIIVSVKRLGRSHAIWGSIARTP